MSLRRPIGIAIELLAGIPVDHLRHLGPVRVRAVPAAHVQPFLIERLRRRAGAVDAVRRSALRHRHAHRRPDPGDHGAAVHHLDLARRVRRRAAGAQGGRPTASAAPRWEVVRYVVMPYTRVGVIGGVMLGLGRALGETMAVTFVIGNAHRISASLLAPGTTISATIANEFTEADRRPLHLVADRARPHPVRHHLHRARRARGYMLMRIAAADRRLSAMNPLYATPPAAATSSPRRCRLRRDAVRPRPGWCSILGALLWQGLRRALACASSPR